MEFPFVVIAYQPVMERPWFVLGHTVLQIQEVIALCDVGSLQMNPEPDEIMDF